MEKSMQEGQLVFVTYANQEQGSGSIWDYGIIMNVFDNCYVVHTSNYRIAIELEPVKTLKGNRPMITPLLKNDRPVILRQKGFIRKYYSTPHGRILAFH